MISGQNLELFHRFYSRIDISIQLTNQIRQHLIINIPISGECTTALDVAGEGRDEVRVLDQLGHKIGDSGLLEDCLDADVVPFRGVERQELITWRTGIPVDNFLRHAVQWNNHCARILLDGLCRDVLGHRHGILHCTERRRCLSVLLNTGHRSDLSCSASVHHQGCFLHHYPIFAFLASVRKNALFTDDLLLNATLVRESACFTDSHHAPLYLRFILVLFYFPRSSFDLITSLTKARHWVSSEKRVYSLFLWAL